MANGVGGGEIDMPLLNYTTKVPVDKTAAEVQKLLAKAGARAVLSEYDDDGNISSVCFKMLVDGREIGYKLPVEADKVLGVLKSQRGVASGYRNLDQARRIAWRIVKDWVEAQLAIIETQMVRPEQVFLPYAITPTGETVYELVMNGRLLSTGVEE